MLTIEPTQRRWLTVFCAVLLALTGLAVWLSLRLPSFREPPFNFYAMKRHEIFNVYGLTRRQEGAIKLGFAEGYPAPNIGLFGNHIVAAFGADAFGRPEDAEYFFSYHYANLSLPEIYSYLRRVEQKGHLPKKLILVQITPPNADNGHFIINIGNELPPDIILAGLTSKEFLDNPVQSLRVAWEVIENWLHETLNYNTFLLSIIQSGGYRDRTIGPSSCHDDVPARIRIFPRRLQNLFGLAGLFDVFCLPMSQFGAYHRDGSQITARDTAEAAKQEVAAVTRDENPLRDSDRGLRAGDEREIARQIRSIDAIGTSHGVKVVFFVPPVYETDRDESVSNQIFNRAITLIPDLVVIDHRSMRENVQLFDSGIHPSRLYFRILVDELRRRGYVE